VLWALIKAEPRILKEPEPVVAVSSLGTPVARWLGLLIALVVAAADCVNLVCRPWVKSTEYGPVQFDFIEKVKKTFDKVGLSFPFPQVRRDQFALCHAVLIRRFLVCSAMCGCTTRSLRSRLLRPPSQPFSRLCG
jgi:small-conductance mechanosensitive channel